MMILKPRPRWVTEVGNSGYVKHGDLIESEVAWRAANHSILLVLIHHNALKFDFQATTHRDLKLGDKVS
jgi:hypothetical protein